MSPMIVPTPPADATTTTPMISEMRAPYRIRLAISRPSESVPSQCSGEGGRSREPRSCKSGSYGARIGARIAHAANTAISANATTFSGLARIGARATSLRPRSEGATALAMLRPRIEPEIRDVDDEICEWIHDRREQRHAEHRGKVEGDRGGGRVSS